MQFKGLGVPNKYFAAQNKQMYIRLHCLRVLWSLSACFPNLKIILRSRPSIFKFNLKRTVIFLLGKFSSLQSQQAGRVGTNSRFLNPILQTQLQNTCWASPKPDVQHKNALVSHLNDRRISKFLGEKFVFGKSSLIHLILYKTGTITSGFEGKKRK